MMKRALLLVSLVLVGLSVSLAQGRLAAKYNYPLVPGSAQDSVLNGLKSIRGCAFAQDVDGDGRSEIAVTNYNNNGRVHVFETVGNDSIRLIWTSPQVTAGGGGSTPRSVLFTDLDNDGKREVTFQSNANGIYIFEWDGVTGSDNYGTMPSQLIGSSFLLNATGNIEDLHAADVDGDGEQELLVAYNASSNATDAYYVISGVGDWTTNDPGFSSFNIEYTGVRTVIPARYGIGGGSPYTMIPANFDGTGNPEILIHNWNLKNVVPMRVTAANTYVLSDTSTNQEHLFLGGTDDYVALFGGIAADIDADGRDEVYLPTYAGSIVSTLNGKLHMISYDAGQSTSIIDSTNVTVLDASSVSGTLSLFGAGFGDFDANGKREIYTSTSYPFNLIALEFQGGNKKDPANWVSRLVYAGEPTIYTAIRYRDSVGVRDTTYTVDPSFVSKMYAKNTDFDNDGRQDIICPYQALTDSITVRDLTWNTGTNQFDTVLTKIANPKRWGLRVIEYDPSLGVDDKEITIITPEDYKLGQNYPNPFNPSTTISFTLPIKDRISLRVFDVLGREVRTLVNNEERPAGTDQVVWDGKNNHGLPVVSGAYFYTLQFGNFSKTNKMLLVK
jgi:hypothetical protein